MKNIYVSSQIEKIDKCCFCDKKAEYHLVTLSIFWIRASHFLCNDCRKKFVNKNWRI